MFRREPPAELLYYKQNELFDQTGWICKGERNLRILGTKTWLKFEQLSFTVHANQPDMVPGKHALFNITQNSVEMFEILKLRVPTVAACICTRDIYF